ncbi:SMI1/KNR4 family protein (plasmid) [Acinetobacter sp. ESL0695]|uniref:SMI1/KNR4 family protein n=1 Tax=Acinetobacter sp. ESL0695 TaxID=2983215 RepID=UPI0023F0B473|nr:SMI1/KNR4 family protein [Acinetobacter sp. ESL0695]WEV50131.1 SMI1/KNR4 family protein [Acinetobacter sp. ESL0695]
MTKFPKLLNKLHQLDFDYAHGDGIDFEPYQNFMSKSEASQWLKSWTGNNQADAASLLIFGQDGTGGYAAFWMVNLDKEILDQPIVFLGSEGEIGVVAKDFNDYLWLLAQNHGPLESIEYPKDTSKINNIFLNFAKQNSKSISRPVSEILSDAQNSNPNFKGWIESLIR